MITFASGTYQLIAGAAGCVAGSICSYLLLEMAFRMRLKVRFRQKGLIAAEGIVAAAIVLGFFAGKNSYDTYLPETEKIASVESA